MKHRDSVNSTSPGLIPLIFVVPRPRIFREAIIALRLAALTSENITRIVEVGVCPLLSRRGT
jgi:hypothetical protein